MRYGRIESPDGRVRDVRFEGDQVVADDNCWSFDEVRVLAPVVPGKLLYVGMNYVDHAKELGVALPEEPLLFFKPPSAVIGDSAEIVHPRESTRVDYEGELAVVIGRRARDLSPSEAIDAVAGYTIANDVTARDFQQPDTQWTKAKAWDTFAPLGPWVETDIDPADVKVETYLNGALRQHSTTSNLCFAVDELVAYASRLMTLEAGDVIATGTPAGIGPMRAGDEVEVRIDGIGRLHNTVVADR
jgi:2-keto-4-pentenoate hydratase/2-oxohepta-3-ene-1,7-dioic acid hydratase in catechol pathway